MKKLILAMIIALTLPIGASAQILPSANPEADSLAFAIVRERLDSIRQYRPTVGLVLAGGGAKGLAHLGVIKLIEELGIPVDVVTGTSMGGLVGGLYALGYKHDQLDSLVRAINWPVMMSDNIPNEFLSYKIKTYRNKFVLRVPFHYDNEDIAKRRSQNKSMSKMETETDSDDEMEAAMQKIGLGMPDGYLYGLNVRNTLSSVSVGYQDSISFANLPIPYACVATDMYTMAPKYWTGGDIAKAMRSTMAIPFYFRAVRGDGGVLLDGGMRNNYPADIAREMGADIIIGSEMSTPRGLDDLNSPVDLLFQTITLLSTHAVSKAREMINLNVHHELKGYNMLSFDEESVDDIISQGYQNALQSKEVFEAIAAQVTGCEDPDVCRHAPAINIAQTKVKVKEVKFTGLPEDEQQLLLRRGSYPADSLFDRTIIERLLNNIYGTNAFEAISYHLEGSHEPYTLVFDCQKGQVNDFAVGLRADTDETVAVALHLGLGTRRLYGPRMTADVKLGTNPRLNLEGSYKFKGSLPTVGMTLRNHLLNSSSGYISENDYRFLSTAADLFIEDARMRYGSMRAGVTYETNPYERYLSILSLRMPDDTWYKNYWLSAFATLKVDTFDDVYFPTKGIRMSLDGRYVFKGHSNILDDSPDVYHPDGAPSTPGGRVPSYFSTMASLAAALSLGDNFTILPSVYAGWYGLAEDMSLDPDALDTPLPRDYMNPMHIVSCGGFIPNRFTERQIPFFGMPTAYTNMAPVGYMGQLDLRYRFLQKNYITLRGAIENDMFDWAFLSTLIPIFAVGAEYARQTMIGPLKLSVQWCNFLSAFTAYASFGFDF